MAGFFTPSLLIDRNIMLDAGSFGSILSLQQQLEIDHFLISHAHSDHIKDLACFADLVIGRRKTAVKVHASPGAMEVIRGDLFNNRMWPDFFSLPSPEHPVLKAAVFKPGSSFKAGHLRVHAIPVSHPVESMAFIIRGPGGSFVYTGDTGPTDRLWKSVNRLKDLKLLMIECKFPNAMQIIAEAAGHLTPRTLASELAKVRDDSVPVLLYHLKPDRMSEIVQEISSLGDSRLHIMKIGERIRV